MATKRATSSIGWRVYGLSVLAFGVLGLVWGDFVSGQPVPKNVPDRTILAYTAAVFLIVAGGATAWRRTAARGAHPVLLAHYRHVVRPSLQSFKLAAKSPSRR